MGYAISLWQGADEIKRSKLVIEAAAAPAFLLIGFAIENALAAYLIYHLHQNPADYKSHDLLRAARQCPQYGLVLSKASLQLLEFLNPHHTSFSFRYPEKAIGTIPLPDLSEACRASKEIIRDAYVMLKIAGVDIDKELDNL